MAETTINIVISIPQLDAFLSALGDKIASAGTPTPAPRGDASTAAAEDKPARTRRSAKDKEADAPATDDTSQGTVVKDVTGLDYETQVKPKIIELGKVKGRDAAKAMLTEFDVTSGTELDSAVYPAVLKRIDEMMQPDPEGDIA